MQRCPECESEKVVKNGHIHNGKQRYRCKDCKRQFILDPKWRAISQETKEQIDRLLLEKIPLAGIARSMQVSESWLQLYVNEKYRTIERKADVRDKKGT